MGNLSNLAAAIEGKRPPIADDIDPALARRNAATADAIRAAGVPDAFNRFLPENEHLNMKPPGPKEAQLRSLRISPKTFAAADKVAAAIARSTPTAPAPATKPATPAPAAVATQETTMKSKTSKKTPAKKTSKPVASKAAKKAATAAKPKATPAKKPKAAKTGGKESKADVIERMLKAPNGTTRKALSDATGYAYVNLTMAAKRAEMKIVEADGRVQLVPKDAPDAAPQPAEPAGAAPSAK